MTKKKMSTDSVLRDQERMAAYKQFAMAFSYPKEESLRIEYDKLFRASEIWLYGAEHIVENEFQRAQKLADINGFYRAFGLEPDRDRPDSLACELEFMHYLIFKALKAPDREKAAIAIDAQKKFFTEHLYPAGKKIIDKITYNQENGFYREGAERLLKFLEMEKKNFSEVRN